MIYEMMYYPSGVRCFQNKCTVNLRSLPLHVNVLEQERVNQRVALCLMASNPQSDKYKYENQQQSQ